MSEICLICLKTNSELLNIGKDYNENDGILNKLMECIPELVKLKFPTYFFFEGRYLYIQTILGLESYILPMYFVFSTST